ncbi:hypothetical protein FRB95_014229 [Tulasnella sp. JGI-2019a]|nr:hypothetical protein FRB93_012136 [Tulasnella sp. JGI-2019a]KAG9033808.1 hypothetical protein FRB95_014229 [Tulasnella sp. JGI-2019a]
MAHPVQSLPSFAHTFSDIPRQPHRSSSSRSPLPVTRVSSSSAAPSPPSRPLSLSLGTKRRHHETIDSPTTQRPLHHLQQLSSSNRPARASKRLPSGAVAPQIPTPSPHPRSSSDQDADAEEEDEMEEDVMVKEEEPDEIDVEDTPPAPLPAPVPTPAPALVSLKPPRMSLSNNASPTHLHPTIQDSKTYTYPTDNQVDSPSARKKRRVTISGSNPLLQLPLRLNTSARALAVAGGGATGGPASAFPGSGSGPLTPGVSPVVIGFSVPRTPSGVPQRVSVDQVRSALTVKQQQKALIEARKHNPNASLAATPNHNNPPPTLPTPPTTGSTNGNGNGHHHHHSSIHSVPSATVSAPSHSSVQLDHPRDAIPHHTTIQGPPPKRSRAVTVAGMAGGRREGGPMMDVDSPTERQPSVMLSRPGSSTRPTPPNNKAPNSNSASSGLASSSNTNSNLMVKQSPSDPTLPSSAVSSPSHLQQQHQQPSSLLARRKGPGAPGSALGVNTSGISTSSEATGLTTGDRDMAMDDISGGGGSASGPQGWAPSVGMPQRRQSSSRTPVLTVRTSGINPISTAHEHGGGIQSATLPRDGDPGRSMVVEGRSQQMSGISQVQQQDGRERMMADGNLADDRRPVADGNQQRRGNETAPAHRPSMNIPITMTTTTNSSTVTTIIPRNPMLALDPIIRSAPLTHGGKMLVSGSGRPSPTVGPNSPAVVEAQQQQAAIRAQAQTATASVRPPNPFLNRANPTGASQQVQVPISTTLRTPHASHFSIPARNPYAATANATIHQQQPPQQSAAGPSTGHGTATAAATTTGATGGATDKQSFLNLFGQFYDSLNDAKHLKTWLEGQIASSDKLLSTLERATREMEIERTRSRNVEHNGGAGGAESQVVQQLRTRVGDLEARLATLEARQQHAQYNSQHQQVRMQQAQRDSAMDVDSGSGGEMQAQQHNRHMRSSSGTHPPQHLQQQPSQHRRVPSRTITDMDMAEGRSSATSSPGYPRRTTDSRRPGNTMQHSNSGSSSHGHGHSQNMNATFQFGGGAPPPSLQPRSMDPPVPSRSRPEGSSTANSQQQQSRQALPLPPIASFANGTDDRDRSASSSRRIDAPAGYDMGRRGSIQSQHLSPNVGYPNHHSNSRSPPQLPPLNGAGGATSRSPQPHGAVSHSSPMMRARGSSPRVLSRGSPLRASSPPLQPPTAQNYARRASRDSGVVAYNGIHDSNRRIPNSNSQQPHHRGVQAVSKATSTSSASPPAGQRLVAVGGRAANRDGLPF